MKKILIVSHAMELGGAERALLGLLDSIDYKNYQVDLFLLRHEGELLPYINPNVRLLPQIPAYTVLARPMSQTLKEGHVLLTSARMYGKFAAKLRCKKLNISGENSVELECSHKYTRRLMPQISNEKYDLAISFLTPHYFTAEKVNAELKIAWIHTDYSVVKIDRQSEFEMWSRFDYIASVSENVGAAFGALFPLLKNKIINIENIQPENLICSQANEADITYDMPDNGAVKLLSIGRFCNAKNFDNVPDICSRLISMGLNVTWYLIGFGGGEAIIREKTAEAGMEKHVIILGKKENPYPYIKKCDLYVQPSRYEGKSVTVREAQMLCKPVVITRYATSASQLEDGVDGVIVPMDNEGCAKGIAEVLTDPERMKAISAECRGRNYSNRGEIEKLYKVMD